ncbi:MAG: hypothetical protein FVQ84_03955 [Planctomycetes bacterium]|nr:hypothetical protein [Planctomycetota bacterium]
MSETINVENKKQNRQKPPLSVGRIAREILAGTALSLVALLVVNVIGFVLVGKGKDEYAGFGFLTILLTLFPPLNGWISAVGVHLVGSRGKQTGSFLLTLAGGFVGGLVAFVALLSLLWIRVEIVLLAPLLLLIPPIFATLGFNLTRKYEEPPSS